MSNDGLVRVFCKFCCRATKHMDFRPLPVGYKCTECGEYNQHAEEPA